MPFNMNRTEFLVATKVEKLCRLVRLNTKECDLSSFLSKGSYKLNSKINSRLRPNTVFRFSVFAAHCIQESQEEFDVALSNQFGAPILAEDFELALEQYGLQTSFCIEVRLSKKEQAQCILTEVRKRM